MSSQAAQTQRVTAGPAPSARREPARSEAEGVSATERDLAPKDGDVRVGVPSVPLVNAEDVAKYERVVARLLSGSDTKNRTLAVTSSVSGEGVSTVCVGLAVALARSTTKSVLLVDANLRRPALHERFGVPLDPGLCDLIAGTANHAASRTTVPNLCLLPSGTSHQSPAQLMTSEAARARIPELQNYFDYVIVDCPPVLSAVDAPTLCRLASGVIIVLRSGLTPREDVGRTRDLLDGAPIMGVILNGV